MAGHKRSRQTRPGVFVVIGSPQDACALAVRAALEARRRPTIFLTNPLASPGRFAWRLDDEQCASELRWEGGPPARDGQIAGAFVRRGLWIDPAGWQPDDLAYLQAETQAALLAWLWSLRCPVVNRFPSAVWYQPQQPLLAWHRLLRHSGLPTLETLVTNLEPEARAFGQRLALDGVSGAVYGPLSSATRYLVSSEHDWSGLAALQGYAPVCLAAPHGAAQLACVVGEQVVWEGGPPPEAPELEPALRRFAAAAGLAFVELALAPAAQGLCVVAVEPQPLLERYSPPARDQIVGGLLQVLAGSARGAV